jgi:hypothetical protein
MGGRERKEEKGRKKAKGRKEGSQKKEGKNDGAFEFRSTLEGRKGG